MEKQAHNDMVIVYDIGVSNQLSAFNHYAQVAALCKQISIKEYLEPPENYLIRAKLKLNSSIGVKRKLYQEWSESLLNKLKEREKTRNLIKTLTEGILTEHNEAENLTKVDMFVPRELPDNWNEMVINNFSEAKAHETWVSSDQTKELKCASIIRQSFGRSFRAHITGKLGGVYESIPARKLMSVFVDDFMLKLSGDEVDRIKVRIKNFAGWSTVTSAADGVVNAYTSLDVAGVVVHDAERARAFIESVKNVFGEQAYAALIILPVRIGCAAAEDGTYAFTDYIKGINSVRTDLNYFGSRSQSLSAIKQNISQYGQNGGNGNASARNGQSQSTPTTGMVGTGSIISSHRSGMAGDAEREPKIGDSVSKWNKRNICGYHYPNYVERGQKPMGWHTNDECKRNKQLFTEKYKVWQDGLKSPEK